MIVPTILSGGIGSRLWPLSRRARPKQFLKIFDNTSLFQLTCERVSDAFFSPPIIICNQMHRFIVGEQLSELNISPNEIVLEPVGRNTAASTALASLLVSRMNPDALVLLLPSDHLISNPEPLISAIRKAVNTAKNGSIVTFGVEPDSPHTGYGYMKLKPDAQTLNEVEKFIEKPDEETAKSLLAEGNYVWNSGIFLFSANHMLGLFEKYQPEILNCVRKSLNNAERDLDFLRLEPNAFGKVPDISFDFAIMEKAENTVCGRVAFEWNDLGSWSSLWNSLEKDADENSSIGEQHVTDGHRNLTISENCPVFLLGVDNLVVVNTNDTLLVADMGREQEVREIVRQLDEDNRPEPNQVNRTHKPWGWTEKFMAGENFIVNLMVINPGMSVSRQSHKHRAEHWVVISGSLQVSMGEKQVQLETNQSAFVPKGITHKLNNTGTEPARIIEIQTGTYFGEDDIIRE